MKAGFLTARVGVVHVVRSGAILKSLSPYLIAVVCIAVLTLIRVWLAPVLGSRFVYVTYFAAIAATAWFGGWGASLFCTVGSFLVADWFFIPPPYSFNLLKLQTVDWIGLVEFSGVGMVITAFSQAARKGQLKAEKNAQLAGERGQALEEEIVHRKMAEEALARSEKRLQLALESAHMVSWDWDLERHEITFSSNVSEVFGVRAPSIVKELSKAFPWIHPDDLEAYRKQLLMALERCEDYVTRFRITRSDGGLMWAEDHGGVVCGLDGKPVRISGVVLDITERKQAEEQVECNKRELERRVEERTARYQAINKELEAFNYSVSHDLRAPLRAIFSFTQLLEDEYGGKLDTRGQEYLQFVIQGAARMNQTVEDLLALARLTQRELRHDNVDLSAVVWGVAEELKRTEPWREVKFLISPTPIARCDKRLMRIVLENLISNAWKFTTRKPGARIEFGAERENGGYAYYVKDNGAGFSMENAKLLFGPFQRLHAVGEFPGTGIGLATVHRIITRHGGKIWAHGEMDKGAVFYFMVP